MDTATAAPPLRRLTDRIEALASLDGPARRIGRLVRGAIAPGPTKDLLSGTALGHAVHPVLTDVVIGSWTSASLLDLVGGRDSDPAAERLIAIGIAAYGPTALTGVTDWSDAELGDSGVRRVGLVHAASNATALSLYAASYVARRRGSHGRGVALGFVGAGALAVGGFLGGHLALAQGVGADQTAFDPGPTEWTPTVTSEQVGENASLATVVHETPVLLHRASGTVLAVHDRCSHRGCSLASGRVTDGVVECPCHGSRFRLSDGEVLRGPATAPQPSFEVRESGGRLEVRRRVQPSR